MINTFSVGIEGITPMIINRFHEEAASEATSGTHGRKEYDPPEVDAQKRLYLNGNGPYFPAENLRQCIIEAAKRHKINRRSATQDVAAATYVLPFELDLRGAWHVDSRPIVNPNTGGRILRHRPMFDEWSIDFRLEVDMDLVSEKLIKDIVLDAGRLVGLGDFRPARKGPFGRFQIVRWERQK